jgi:hypothetical protein
MLCKDDAEHPLPEPVRDVFRRIAEAFVAGDFQLHSHPVAEVKPVDPETAQRMRDYVSAYGGTLARLDEATWERSAYRWMEGYWDVLVDLTTTSEPVSDLTLHAKLSEKDDGFEVALEGVWVP